MVRGQTILITGAAGFVGSYLTDVLVDQNEVIALDHFNTNSRDQVSNEATIVEGDIRDQKTIHHAAEDVDLIFHQAALKSISTSIENPLETHTVNVDGTLALLEVARDIDARVIIASSAAIYGEQSELPIPETAPTQPLSPYGIQKLAIDHYSRLWHDLYGLETVVLRYFNIYGRRVSGSEFCGVVGSFIDQASNGRITVDGDGAQTRDFVHISDVVQANLLAATTDHVGYAYNIGSGRGISIDELAHTVREYVNSSAEIIYTDERVADTENSLASITRAQEKLRYEPKVQLEQCLNEQDQMEAVDFSST